MYRTIAGMGHLSIIIISSNFLVHNLDLMLLILYYPSIAPPPPAPAKTSFINVNDSKIKLWYYSNLILINYNCWISVPPGICVLRGILCAIIISNKHKGECERDIIEIGRFFSHVA